jgi:hypothetical protein
VFILYYQDDDYYYAKPEFLLCSPNREDLEREKENLVKISEKIRNEIQEYERTNKERKEKDWIEFSRGYPTGRIYDADNLFIEEVQEI